MMNFKNSLVTRGLVPLLMTFLVLGCGEEVEEDDEFDPDDLGGNLIQSDVERAPATASSEMLDAYALGQAEFAIRFLRAGFDDDKNSVFSPYNLAEAMTIAATFEMFEDHESQAIQTAVGIDNLEEAYDASNSFRLELDERVEQADPEKLAYANLNDIWVEEAGTANGFDLDNLQRYFGVGIRQTPLGSDTELGAKTINEYIEYHTQGLIPELISEGQLIDVFAVVTTALYLKASWTGSFSEGSPQEFHLDDTTSKDVPAMRGITQTESNIDPMMGEFPDDEPMVMSIPLEGGFTFDIIAPAAGTLPEYFAEFDAAMYHELLDKTLNIELNVTMPVFEIDAAPSAKMVMMDEFGLPTSIFDLGKIGDIIHQSVIDVNETGIEAAAASAVTFYDNGDTGPELSVSIDRPFLYFLRDSETRVILFAGQYFGE